MTKPEEKFTELYDIITKLRKNCPWDKKQTPESIKKYLIEEAEELAEAVSHKSSQHVCEETGDLLFILMMIIRIYEEDNNFTITDVLSKISNKMIRRHPHVFAGKETGSEDELKKQWETIKAQEKNKP